MTTPSEIRVLFMGSPAYAVPSLDALITGGYQIVGAVTQPDRPAGRGGRMHQPEVKVAALSHGIPVFQPDTLRDAAVQAQLGGLKADVFVVAAYGKILPRTILALPLRGCVNVHASLLPRWRGASPIAAAILAGDDVTGVSIMELEARMDAGPVIARRSLPLGEGDTTGAIELRLAELGAQTLVEILPGWYRGELLPEPQDDSLATYCQLLTKADGHLRASMTVRQAERAVRAYKPWPGAFVVYRSERLMIWSAHIAAWPAAPAGTTFTIAKQPAIAFEDGVLVLDEVQRPGSKHVTGQQFLNGEHGNMLPAVGLA